MEISTKVDQLLGQMRAAQSLASKLTARVGTEAAEEKRPDFAAVLKSSIEQVNATQKQAETMATEFELGTKNVQLHDVMISLSKANVSFQQMVQVRNRLVSAYHDIMNMQV